MFLACMIRTLYILPRPSQNGFASSDSFTEGATALLRPCKMFSGRLKNTDVCGIAFEILQEISRLLLHFFCESFISGSQCVYICVINIRIFKYLLINTCGLT